MAKNEIKIDRLLLGLLVKNGGEAFSVTELRDQYMIDAPSGFDLDARKTRLMIYRQLLRLERKGFITRQPGTSGKKVMFLFTKQASSHRLVGIAKPSKKKAANQRPQKDVQSGGLSSNSEADLIPELQAKLRRYKMEMMTSFGEAEEYEELIEKHPALRPELEPNFLIARDQGAKIYGQARALEKFIFSRQGKTE